jgi:hypothetical protein
MGLAARRRFEERFTALQMARSYQALYRELVSTSA